VPGEITLEAWTRLLGRDLRALPREMDGAVQVEGDGLAATARALAPRRTGALRRSIRVVRDRRGRTMITSSHPGAEVQSAGGTVRPERGEWLRVPLSGRSDTPGEWIRRARDGRLFVGSRSRIVAVLVRSVRLRGSGYLERALQAHLDGGARVLRRLGLPGVTGG
jgi:hypothetical protein